MTTEDTQTKNWFTSMDGQVLGVKSLITARVQKRIAPQTYKKVIELMWEAMEKAGVHNGIASGSDLSIVLLAGKETNVEDYLSGKRELTTKVKEDSQ